jgi:hypothetical protein
LNNSSTTRVHFIVHATRKTSTPSVHSSGPEHGTDASSIYDDSPGSTERSASDSADNPSAAATARLTTDERYDERSARGEGDGGVGIRSEAEARLPSYQLGGEPSVCSA